MILVFSFVLLTVLIIFCFIISKLIISIDIQDINIDTDRKAKNKKLGTLFIYIICGNKKLKIKEINIEKERILYLIEKSYNKKFNFDKRTIKIFNRSNFQISKFNMNLQLGTDDCILTTKLVAIISILTSFILSFLAEPGINKSNFNYCVFPIYNKIFAKLELNCIINVKLVHIICIIFLIWKGSRKNERTSNRKSYEYSYEQH